MRLARRPRAGMMISVTPLVDVMLILLIFFMVTSTYLDLDMIPLAGGARMPAEGTATAEPAATDRAGPGESLLVRLRADGEIFVSGRPVAVAELGALISERLGRNPSLKVLVLPSGAASTQSLVTLMDTVTVAGAQNVRVVRIEAQ